MSNRPNRRQHRERIAAENRDWPTITMLISNPEDADSTVVVTPRCRHCGQRYAIMAPRTPFQCDTCHEAHYDLVSDCAACPDGTFDIVVPVGDRRYSDDPEPWPDGRMWLPEDHPLYEVE